MSDQEAQDKQLIDDLDNLLDDDQDTSKTDIPVGNFAELDHATIDKKDMIDNDTDEFQKNSNETDGPDSSALLASQEDDKEEPKEHNDTQNKDPSSGQNHDEETATAEGHVLDLGAEGEARSLDFEDGQEPAADSNSDSKFVKITNLSRPFSLPGLKRHIEALADCKIQDFWINSIKSTCYVILSSHEEASKKLISELNGAVWPESNLKTLVVVGATLENKKDDIYRDENGEEPPKKLANAVKKESASAPLELRDKLNAKNQSKQEERAKRDQRSRSHDRRRSRSNSARRSPNRRSLSRDSNRERSRNLSERESKKDGFRSSTMASVSSAKTFAEVKKKSPSRISRERAYIVKNSPIRRREIVAPCPEPPARMEIDTLHNLYKCTEAEPRIFWRPNTEAEIKQKRKRSGLDRSDRPSDQTEARTKNEGSESPQPKNWTRVDTNNNGSRPSTAGSTATSSDSGSEHGQAEEKIPLKREDDEKSDHVGGEAGGEQMAVEG